MRHLYLQTQKSQGRQKSLLLICGAVILLMMGWLMLDYGKWRAIYQEMAGVIAKKTLASEGVVDLDSEVNKELTKLRKEITILETAAQVDKVAEDEVRKALRDLENENLGLREEIGFYKNIMASTKESRGIKIQGFRLATSNDKHTYQFELILTRIVKGGALASGEIKIFLHGNGNSGKMDYDLKELLKGKESMLSFKIKHFKRIDGAFTLPADFVPETVKVVIQPHEEKAKAVEKVYYWIDITV